ncbi:MAG: hypothetical protein JXA13_00605 [Anaerolineales bacterium]|nr:hypothetical protein [Anaerolineales bacterium]
MNNLDHIFKPEYPFLQKHAPTVLPVIFVILILYGTLYAINLPPLFWICMLILAVIASLLPYFFIREIRFTQNFVVRRYFLPDRFLELEEIANIDAHFVHLKNSRIRLGGLTNIEALQARFQRWRSASLLKGRSQKDTGYSTLFPMRGAGSYAFMWGLFTGVTALMLQPDWITLDERWFFGVIFLVVYLLHVYLLPKII